ncbi:MAG: zf-HC2 domain-containing protein [Acidobacteriota bacterium]
MNKCQELEPLLASYADGEAAADARVSVDAHLDRCRKCRHRVEAQRVAREVLSARRAWLRPSAPAALRARCAAQQSGDQGGARLRAWLPLSLAATLVLAVAGAFVFGLNDNVEAVAAQLAVDHARCFQFAPERLTHVDAAVAERAWAVAHGWVLRVPRGSADERLELLGVRRCVTASGTTAHLLYRWRGEPLSVFVLPRNLRRPVAPDQIMDTFGHEAVAWSAPDRTYVVVAQGRPADLPAVVAYLQAGVR